MKRLSLVLAPCLAIMTSCSTITVKHDYDTDIDFAPLKTFSWMVKPARATSKAGLYDKRIKSAVNSQLEAKGFEKKPINSDFIVAYHVGVKERINVQDWGYGYGRRRYYRGRDIRVQQYTQGTLILDIVDAQTKQLIWRGTAQGAVDPSASPQERQERLNEAVSKILEKFPPVSPAS